MKTNRTRMKNKRSAPGRQRPAKQGIHVKGSWKAVELDPSLFSEEGMGGLVCFEELTDYRLVDPTKVAAKEQKKEKKKAKKRKASEEEEGGGEHLEESEAVDPETDASGKPAKKKSKKRKKKTYEEESTEREDVTVDGEEKKELERDQCPEVTLDEGGDEEDTAEEKSKDSALFPGIDDEPQSTTKSKDKKKKKKKRKNKGSSGQATGPDLEAETLPHIDASPQAEEQSTLDKVAKLPKKKAKNWTNAALSDSADQKADVSAWKGLFVPAPVLKALSSLGFSSPTPIQALALPPAIRDRMDIVGAAETGSGKTLSFGIPMIHMVLEWKKGPKDLDEAEDQNETSTRVESLYLPDEAPEINAEANASIDTNATAETTADDVEDASVEVTATSTSEQDQESKMEDGTEEDGATQDDKVGSDNDESVDDSVDEDLIEEDGEQLGCVKVIENVEFDFDAVPEAEEQPSNQSQPLLGLVLTPTRELAVQVKHHIDAVAKFTGIKTAIIVGGMAQQKQKRMLKRRPEIVIATPGRLWELIKEKQPHLQNLRQLRCLVIDEADRMVERGHFAELESLMEMLNTHQFNPKRQTFVFSATLTMVHSLPTRILQKKKKAIDQRSKLEVLMEKVGIKAKPKVIDLTRKEATVESLTETQIHCEKEEKDFFLYYFLLQYPGRTMVFANSIDCIKRLNCLLVILDHTPLPLHANMHQKQRLKNLERFAERDNCVLLTTDVAARGLDIPNVQHVIHYQVPRTSETYVHRSGRTARATKEGLSLLLIGPDDMMNFKKIYKTLGKDEDLPVFPVQTKCMAAIKERVNLARKIEKVEFFNKREKQHNSWFKQAADALDVDLDDDVLLGQWKDEEDDRQQQKMVKGMKKQLKHLLSQPVFKHDVKTRYPTQMGKLSLPKMPLAGMETAITSVSIQRKKRTHKKKQEQ